MKRWRKMPWWGKALVGSAVLLFFCCACGLIGSLGVDESALEEVSATLESETLAQTEETEDVAESTAAATEAVAQNEPTNTPQPTNTPRPTATINPEATIEAEYIDMVLVTSELYGTAMSIIGEQTTAAGENPTLLFDEDWLTTTAVGVFGVTEASRLVLDYEGEIPARFVEVNQEYQAIAQLYADAMDSFVIGIDTIDSEKINEASALMIEGTERLSALSEVVEEMNLPAR